MILLLLLNTPYLSNMIIWLSSVFNDKVCVISLRSLFHRTVFPLIFRSPLGTDIIFVCLSPFMYPWILSKFVSVSYLWSVSYLFRVCLPPNSHPSCKCMVMRSQAWAISFYSFLQNLPVYFSPSARRLFRRSSPSTRWPIKVLWMNFSAWLGCCRELGKLQIRSLPGRAIDALYARRSPQDNYTLNWEFPPLPSVLLDSFLHRALFPDFLRGWKEKYFAQSGNSVLHFIGFPFTE